MLIALALAAILFGMTLSFSIDWFRKERVRGSIHTIQTQLQLARVEALRRNRACRFTLNENTKRVRIIDLHEPGTSSDDEEIAYAKLSDGLVFAHPQGGPPITLKHMGGPLYETTFAADGSTSSGSGAITLNVDQIYFQISVYVAGGIHARYWNGTNWASGT
ncbi:MAG: GspH/FimT family pseudopilin [Acidobacteriota bacterium]|nr:MAG: GspH/FimT family pseudopilin [Acidobacteriota bacterium]